MFKSTTKDIQNMFKSTTKDIQNMFKSTTNTKLQLRIKSHLKVK
jgi:ferritin-like metal-binding protein YciE